MKYKFIFDESFANKNFFQLTSEEAILVAIAVSGGHNVILHGSEPERLVKAIKSLSMGTKQIETVDKDVSYASLFGDNTTFTPGAVTLANNGVLFINDYEGMSWVNKTVLRSILRNKKVVLSRCGETRDMPANFQLVATINPNLIVRCPDGISTYRDLFNQCGIIYKCSSTVSRMKYSRSELMTVVKNINSARLRKDISYIADCDVSDKDQVVFTTGAWDFFKREVVDNEQLKDSAWEIAGVAKTLRFYSGNIMTKIKNVEYAIKYHSIADILQ